MHYTLLHGDNREQLKHLADNSIDSIVCDPPYELGFMGKRWDSTGIAYDGTVWTECLRVLKPGGHLIAFGGTRTYHRMTVAIEDAGFEIRDCIMWLYGSGFPKSLAIDKAIDKQRDDRAQTELVVEWLEKTRKESGVSRRKVEEHFGTVNVGQSWFTSTPGMRPRVPTLEQIPPLLALFGMTLDDVPEDIRTLIWTLNGRKGQPGEAWYQREVVTEKRSDMFGEYEVQDIRTAVNTKEARIGMPLQKNTKHQITLTAPATDLAKQWHGWGTAAKPAHEPAILAYKPHDTEHGIIIANLQRLEAQLWLIQFVCSAEWNSTSSLSELSAVLSIAQWTADELISTKEDLCVQMDTSQLSEVMTTCLSIVQSWKHTWEEASIAGSTFITATVLSPIIGWTTLRSSASHLTPNSITKAVMEHGTTWQRALSAALPFVVASEKLRSTLELIAVEHAISETYNPADIDKRTAVEPAVLARKPLIGTVADNVTAWGVGGINVDGCRIPSDDGYEKAWDRPVRTNISKGSATYGTGRSAINGTHLVDISANKPSGRWPANVILDEDAGEALDEQSGERISRKFVYKNTDRQNQVIYGVWAQNGDGGYSDSGGASRFFYTAKASKAEREAGLEGMEIKNNMRVNAPRENEEEKYATHRANHHPTVKPIALMRYLVRLVTPKGGTVLDPFMGSGSTGCAAMCEGVNFVGIELSEEYLEIARRRIEYWQSQNPMGL